MSPADPCPSRAQWRELSHVADRNNVGKLAISAGPNTTASALELRGWIRTVRVRDGGKETRGYEITESGRAALERAQRRYLKWSAIPAPAKR